MLCSRFVCGERPLDCVHAARALMNRPRQPDFTETGTTGTYGIEDLLCVQRNQGLQD